MKRGFKIYILPLVLTVALAWPVLGLAAEAPTTPEYTDEARAAAPTISVDGVVEQGDVIAITVEQGPGAIATRAAISTQGLQFLQVDSGFSTRDHVVLMNQFSRQTYHYKVTGYPGTNVYFSLSDIGLLLSSEGDEQQAPPTRWRQTVTGDPTGPSPTPTVYPSAQPSASASIPAVTAPVIISGSANIKVSGNIVQGGTIQVEISCAAAGLDAEVRAQGLQFLEVSNLMSSERNVILVNSGATQSTATYTYRITAAPGETISVEVRDVIISVNGQDVDGERSAWIATVGAASTGNHAFGLTGGLSTQTLSSGRSALVGLTATRRPVTVNELLRSVIRPSTGSVAVQNSAGATLSGSSTVTSGCRLVVIGESGNATDDYAVVAMSGDVLGTGVASISQLVSISKYVNGISYPTELQRLCADVNGNGRIEIGDLTLAARQMRS